MRKTIILCCFLFLSIQSQSQTNFFDALLKTYVDAKGNIDYKGLRKNRAILDTYLNELNNTIPNKKWSTNEAKAFWINAYNAYLIKLVIDSYPLKKITDVKRNGKNAWKIVFAEVGKKKYSLDYIEHKILRRWYKDPRVHAALNAGSKSGPSFPNFAFTEENVDTKLNLLMKNFINDTSKNKISPTKIKLSETFKWYYEDFTTKTSTLKDYINKFSHVKIKANAELTYLTYDWSLNEI